MKQLFRSLCALCCRTIASINSALGNQAHSELDICECASFCTFLVWTQYTLKRNLKNWFEVCIWDVTKEWRLSMLGEVWTIMSREDSVHEKKNKMKCASLQSIVSCWCSSLLQRAAEIFFYITHQLNLSQTERKKNEKPTTLSLLCFKLLFFSLKSFMACLLFFPLTANFYLNFGAVVTFSYSEGRRPSHCTQVTQCMWGFAIWIQFSLPPVINAVWILGGHGSKK